MIQDTSSSDVTQENSIGIKLTVIWLQSCYKNSFQIFKYSNISGLMFTEMTSLLQEITLLIFCGQELKTTAVVSPLLLLITKESYPESVANRNIGAGGQSF